MPRYIGSNSHALTVIQGKSLLVINDMKLDKNVNSDFIQFLLNFVGSDPIPINPKYRPMYDYLPVANLEITSNERPNFRGNISGMENKFVFNVFHRDESKPEDLTLKDRMLETMPYILRKAVRIYPEVVASGYNFDTVQGKAIRDQFAKSASVVVRFVEECCFLGKEYSDRTKDLFTSFKNYARERAEYVPSISLFESELLTHFLGKLTIQRVRKGDERITIITGLRRIKASNAIEPKAVPIPLPHDPLDVNDVDLPI